MNFVVKKVPGSHGHWYCGACNIHFVVKGKAMAHYDDCCHRDSKHLIYGSAQLRIVGDRFEEIEPLRQAARQYLTEKWRNRVLVELLDYVSSDTALRPSLNKTKRLLSKYRCMEQSSLLELAVWKAQCQLRADEDTVDPNVKTIEDAVRFVESQRDSWKTYRTELRSTNAIAIVIEHVLPFVGKP